jgi:Fur family ferric uptake transcriptional regulator
MGVSEATLREALRILETFLREKRLKVTEQRRTLMKAALDQPGHFTAENLHIALSRAGEPISMATVYRGLSLLEEAGLLEGHDFADGLRRYERALHREHHDHMVCVDCRAVVEFQNQAIEKQQEQVVAQHGFVLHDHSLTLFVQCRAWREDGRCERREQRARRQQALRP